MKEIYDDVLDGQDVHNWRALVDYWMSIKGQELSTNGQAARSLQDHLHTTGSTSYANKREDYIEKHKRKPGSIEFFDLTHATENGDFVENTTKEFMEKAKSKVDEVLVNAGPSKSRVDVEDDVFKSLMYGNEIPKRPVGYGFGVNSSALFGVHGELLRKRDAHGNDKFMNNFILTRHNQRLHRSNKVLESKVDQSNWLMLEVLKQLRTGNISIEFLDSTTEALLSMLHNQVLNVSIEDNAQSGSNNSLPTSMMEQ